MHYTSAILLYVFEFYLHFCHDVLFLCPSQNAQVPLKPTRIVEPDYLPSYSYRCQHSSTYGN